MQRRGQKSRDKVESGHLSFCRLKHITLWCKVIKQDKIQKTSKKRKNRK